MHHALRIQEVLLNIFRRRKRDRPSLAALARTCHAFKEPALDVLWEELHDLSPLVRCLPEEYCLVTPGHRRRVKEYSFCKPLTQNEWDILRSYARRIRFICIKCSGHGLDQESITSLTNPPISEPLFLNLRSLRFEYIPEDRLLFLMPFPSLVSLHVLLHDSDSLQESLESFSKTSPNIKELTIDLCHETCHYADMSQINTEFVCWWQNLQTVVCPEINLDVHAFLHLSRKPALTQLVFKLNDTLPDQIPLSDLPLSFPNLNEFALCSQSLSSISKLLSQTQLPAITHFSAVFKNRPSKQDTYSFLSTVQTSASGHTIQELLVNQMLHLGRRYPPDPVDPKAVLDLEVLQPSTTFSNLRHIDFNLEYRVELTDAGLLTLGSAWPRLEQFLINKEWGWRSVGITPNGLLQFLQICPSLTRIALAIDTRGYTKCAESLVDPGSSHARVSYIDILDSFIEDGSVSAVSAFFANIGSPSVYVAFRTPHGMRMSGNNRACERRWKDVYQQVRLLSGQHRTT